MTKPPQLNDGQRRAVHADRLGSVNVVAGAGTGKTTVLVERYLKLVRDDGLSPDRILALTFTLKAAAEMRHRVFAAFERELPERTGELHGAWIMNFHQFGHRIIRENAPAFGIDPDVAVLTGADLHQLKRRLEHRFREGVIEGVPLDFGGEMPPPGSIDRRFDTFLRAALDCRDSLFSEEDIRASLKENDHPAYLASVEAVVALGRAYEDEMRRNGMIDFADMIVIPALGLARDERLRRRYVEQFDHILVDEFQDTSLAQNELLRLLSGGAFEHVTVVGDEKQAIYRWRDARVENIREFPGERRPLHVNYRSQQHILDIASGFMCCDDEYKGREEDIGLTAHENPATNPIVLFHPVNDAEAAGLEQARAVAAWIQRLTHGAELPDLPPVSETLAFDDIAVLLRGMTDSGPLPLLERVFEEQRIPYTVVGGANLMETRALDFLHAMLSLLLGGDRTRELLTVMQGEPWRVPNDVLRQLIVKAGRNPGGFREWLSEDALGRVAREADAAHLRELRELLESWEHEWQNRGLDEFLSWAVAQSPLAIELFVHGANATSLDDLAAELDDVARSLDRRGQLDLHRFLDHLRTMIDERKFRDDYDMRLPSGRVRIMTVHQAKGLEFPAVALPLTGHGKSFAESAYLSRDHGIYFSQKLAEPWGRGSKDNPDKPREDQMEALEERCIVYVALTRARDHLFVGSTLNEGMVPRKTKDDRPTLFTDVLSAGRRLSPVVEWRSAPAVAPLQGPVDVAVDTARFETLAADAARARDERAAARELSQTGHDGIQYVTWPDLLAFSKCPLQFFYRRESGTWVDSDVQSSRRAPDPGMISLPKGVDAARFGTVVHDALRQWLGGDGTVPGAEWIRDAARRAGLPEKTLDAAAEKCAALVATALDGPLGAIGESARAEEPFQSRGGNVIVHGVIDRRERNGDGWRVTDYKVGSVNPDYEFQVACYAWAVCRATGEPATARVAYLREGAGAELVDVGPATVAAVDAHARALTDAVAAGRFAPAPGTVCGSCDYRGICPHAATREGSAS